MFNPENLRETLECPICQQMVRPNQLAGAFDIEPAALNFLQEKYPLWQPEKGVCTNCMQNVLGELLHRQEEDARAEPTVALYGILPVGLRLGVNNHFNGAGVTIAFLDSGFSNHPDLAGRIKLYVDASTSRIRELPEVEQSGISSWHGLMTSVVACGNGSLSGGLYRGLASGAEVVLVKVSDPEGHITEEGIGRGLGWVLRNGAKYGIQIVNISLGGNRPNDTGQNTVDMLVEALVAQGILVVCAAGNAGERWLVPPASAPSAITVGGLDDKNSLDPTSAELWHSNYGQTLGGVWKPELVAPSLWLAAPVLPGSGVEREALALQKLRSASPQELPALLVDSELIGQTQLPAEIAEMPHESVRGLLRQAWNAQKLINPYYQHVDGTSFAAPIVSSVAAQMLQANPHLRPAGLKDLIMRTARYLPEVSPGQQGHGVVDPWAAVTAALSTAYQLQLS
ncbi:MAG: S8 family serine peptidase [Chloroflexi bacterium]|nr:S8 family serine peptidase [Chloroflexota bacterium]